MQVLPKKWHSYKLIFREDVETISTFDQIEQARFDMFELKQVFSALIDSI